MKLQIEQIELQEDKLVYSNYVKDTVSLDEDGTDFEYDFKAFIGNLDDIQNVVLRLYGEQGLVKVMGHYADGAEGFLTLEKVEYVQDSPLLNKVRKLQVTPNIPIKPSANTVTRTTPKSKIPSDDIYLLNGWLEALPLNDDLNVLKMVGSSVSDLPEGERTSCMDRLNQQYADLDYTGASYFKFGSNSEEAKAAVVLKDQMFLLSLDDDRVVLYPGNEFQDKTNSLLKKFMEIQKVYRLKTSIIIEGKVKGQGYYLMFNVGSSKFESKKRI